jgi:hypothetical protein
MNHSSKSWAALPGSGPLRVSATQTGTTMPSSSGMKQIRRGEIAPANDAIANRGRVEAFASSTGVQGVPKLRARASSLRHARAKLRALAAREVFLLRSPSMKTVLCKRHRRRRGREVVRRASWRRGWRVPIETVGLPCVVAGLRRAPSDGHQGEQP